MKEALFAKERVITGRRPELDFAKGICILGLILVHCYELIYGDWDSGLGTTIVEYLGYPIGAPLFMFCMGMTIVFSRRNTSKNLALRGVALLVAGQVLNLVRYGVIYGIGYLISGDIFFAIQFVLIISSDIMTFAGLAFLLFGLLNKLNCKPLGVLAVGVVLNIVGMLLEGLECGVYPIDQIFGLFWGTYTESYFPFFNWFIFAAAGYTYGTYYVRLNNLKRWYAIILPVGIILSAVYYFVGIGVDQDLLRIFNSDSGFYFINLLDAIGCIIVSMTFIALMWCIAQLGLKLKGLVYLSKNINKYYCVSYVYISIIMLVYELGYIEMEGDVPIVISALIVLALTTFTVMFYKKYMEKKVGPWCAKHLVPIAVVVVVASVAWTAAGYHFIDVATEECDALMYVEYELEGYGLELGDVLYPNVFNGYLGY